MRLHLTRHQRLCRGTLATLSAAMLFAVPSHAQATAQPSKPAAAKAAATSAAAPQTAPSAAALQQQPPSKPAKPATAAKPATTAKPAAPQKAPEAKRVYIDINHATLKELKNIPGIGDAYGQKIIAGRPYANKSQLLSRKILDASLYETIQGMIVAKK